MHDVAVDARGRVGPRVRALRAVAARLDHEAVLPAAARVGGAKLELLKGVDAVARVEVVPPGQRDPRVDAAVLLARERDRVPPRVVAGLVRVDLVDEVAEAHEREPHAKERLAEGAALVDGRVPVRGRERRRDRAQPRRPLLDARVDRDPHRGRALDVDALVGPRLRGDPRHGVVAVGPVAAPKGERAARRARAAAPAQVLQHEREPARVPHARLGRAVPRPVRRPLQHRPDRRRRRRALRQEDERPQLRPVAQRHKQLQRRVRRSRQGAAAGAGADERGGQGEEEEEGEEEERRARHARNARHLETGLGMELEGGSSRWEPRGRGGPAQCIDPPRRERHARVGMQDLGPERSALLRSRYARYASHAGTEDVLPKRPAMQHWPPSRARTHARGLLDSAFVRSHVRS